jgi:hypothetical protein
MEVATPRVRRDAQHQTAVRGHRALEHITQFTVRHHSPLSHSPKRMAHTVTPHPSNTHEAANTSSTD